MPELESTRSDRTSREDNWRGVAFFTVLVLALIAILAYSGRILGQAPPASTVPVPIAVAFPTAFLAGTLALLSPCSGAIVPAFFAYGFRSPGRLLRQTYVFFLGLALVFVPLGFASSLLGSLLLNHATTIYAIGGVLLIMLGVTTLFGFDVVGKVTGDAAGKVASLGHGAMERSRGETPRVFVYGVIFGFATSSCTAPILGAMATLAVGSGLQSLQAMLLFLTFALGIATPLFVLAAVFERYRVAERGWLKPREVRIAGRSFLLHHLVTGLILVALGIVFIAFRGTLTLTSAYDRFGATEFYDRTTEGISAFFNGLPAWSTLPLAAAGLILGGWLLVRIARPSRERR